MGFPEHVPSWTEVKRNKLLQARIVLQKRKLGPGSYNIKDFLQLLGQKPSSVRGICDGRAGRFARERTVSLPVSELFCFACPNQYIGLADTEF